MLKILGQNSGGSGTGMSYYTNMLGCINRATLGKATGLDGDESEVGTYFHQLMEQYYADPNKEPEFVIEFASMSENAAAVEALNLFKAYRERYPADEFSDVVAIEPQAASNEAESLVLTQEFGSPFTAKFDMVVRLTQADAEFIRKKRGIEVETGVYIVDHKTKKNRSHLLIPEMMLRPQFAAYQHAWNVLHPEEPCKGVIVNIIIRHKVPKDESFLSLLVPPPLDSEVAVAKGIVRDGAAALAAHGPNWKNPTACLNYFRICPFLLNGDCDRVNR